MDVTRSSVARRRRVGSVRRDKRKFSTNATRIHVANVNAAGLKRGGIRL